jgi:hypothetical protein
LVDESHLASASSIHRDNGLISLYIRTCCNFAAECNVCGFSRMHHLARLTSDDGLNATSPLDRFGNSPLHHTAAMGNYTAVMQMVASEGLCTIRNTSGETYLHVYRINKGEELLYARILAEASTLNFPFLIKDHQGRTIGQ